MPIHVQTHQHRNPCARRLAVAMGAVVLSLWLSACRGDDVVPNVFVDEAHCARDLDAAPFGACEE